MPLYLCFINILINYVKFNSHLIRKRLGGSTSFKLVDCKLVVQTFNNYRSKAVEDVCFKPRILWSLSKLMWTYVRGGKEAANWLSYSGPRMSDGTKVCTQTNLACWIVRKITIVQKRDDGKMSLHLQVVVFLTSECSDMYTCVWARDATTYSTGFIFKDHTSSEHSFSHSSS